MTVVNVFKTASALPTAWSSVLLGRVGTAAVKVLRMDEQALAAEVHGVDEVLFVIDGCLELTVAGAEVTVGTGEMYRVAAGAPHAVRHGSRGALLVVEVPEECASSVPFPLSPSSA
jgi:mannose-6-phosphate isomerase-like protein (cupin superfamily)